MATDIVVLTHNRLEHLIATVDALEARTRAPHRITIVDNASGPDLRNWLAEHRDRFHKVILRAENEFIPAFQYGIDATSSDPVMLTDPDLVVPDLEPCWLTRMLDTMDRHADFGIIGIGLDQSNLPPVQEPESVDASELVDGEIVERPVGSTFTLFRRAALPPAYRTPWDAVVGAREHGWRCGWLPGIRAFHLGWDDFRLYPAHLAGKLWYSDYREAQLIERAPRLAELAVAGPVAAHTRALGIPDSSVLELTWSAPAVAASLSGAVAVEAPGDPLPFADGAAGAVVLVDPPADRAAALLRDAARVATGAVVVLAPLAAFDGAAARELAPPGWSGAEAPGPGAAALAVTGRADADAAVGVSTIEDREQWLDFFAGAAFGPAERRLFVFAAERPAPAPEAVAVDPARVRPWRPVATPPQAPKRPGLLRRAARRARREAAGPVLRMRGVPPRASALDRSRS